MHKIKKEFHFTAGHWIPFHKNPDGSPGPCSHLHGHNYRLIVAVEGTLMSDDVPFVMDFADLKYIVSRIIDTWDHKLLIHYADYLSATEIERLVKYELFGPCESVWKDRHHTSHQMSLLSDFGITTEGIVSLGFYSTAENLSKYLAHWILDECPSNIVSCEVECFETPSSSASYKAIKWEK